MRKAVDYTLYLVTDRELLASGTLEAAVESAIRGGCTVVQIREKTASSREFFEQACRIKAITDAHGIPLIVNDRADIALAVRVDGLHIGQSDLPLAVARRLVCDMLVGVSVANLDEALIAKEGGADYLGVGAMFPTDTKKDTRSVSVDELARIKRETGLPIVAIGGINERTLPMLAGIGIDGIAVVSAILSQPDMAASATSLKTSFLSGARHHNA
ncbi:thiamine phosphate synthase [Synergistaceae bacterium OttesenSCG-928-I11]|nr:thiamine phosphate synthase [Synergistaceae bacterium OttesenSCG-928-I11]